MMDTLNNLEAAIRGYNDTLNSALCVSFNEDKGVMYFLDPKNIKLRKVPDWTWKQNC